MEPKRSAEATPVDANSERVGACVHFLLKSSPVEPSSFPEGRLAEIQTRFGGLGADGRESVLREIRQALRQTVPPGGALPDLNLLCRVTDNVSALNDQDFIRGYLPVVIDAWLKVAPLVAYIPHQQRDLKLWNAALGLGAFIRNHAKQVSFEMVLGLEEPVADLIARANERSLREAAEVLGLVLPGTGRRITLGRLNNVGYGSTSQTYTSSVDTHLLEALRRIAPRDLSGFFGEICSRVVEDPREDTDVTARCIRTTLAQAMAERIDSQLPVIVDNLRERSQKHVVGALYVLAHLPESTGADQRAVLIQALEGLPTIGAFGLHDRAYIQAVAETARDKRDLLLIAPYGLTESTVDTPDSILEWHAQAMLRALQRLRRTEGQH